MSARDKLRAVNFGSLDGNATATEQKNIVTDLLESYSHEEEKSSTPVEEKTDIQKEIDVIAESLPESEIIKSEPKKSGRPPIYSEKLKTVTVRLTEANYNFAKRNGWEFGGYTGYT